MTKKFHWALATTLLVAAPATAQTLDLEVEDLTFGFIKLTDMAPLAVAYERQVSLWRQQLVMGLLPILSPHFPWT